MNYLVSLDGAALNHVSDLAPIRVADVIELQPSRTTNTKERLGIPGSFVTRDHINNRQVRVQFAVLTSSYAERTAVLSDVSAWAMQGRLLEISDRPGQQLHVVCTDTPLTMSKRTWTDLCEMTFTAFSIPFWEDTEPITVHAGGITEGTLTLCPRGNVRQVPLRCTVKPTTSPLTTLTLAANGTEMTFSGLSVPAGKALVLDCPDGYLTASWVGDDGIVHPCLSFRTGAEHIPLNTRQNNAVAISANTEVDVTLSARGWYW